jgi:Fe-S cluster biogenesis protein NfuA
MAKQKATEIKIMAEPQMDPNVCKFMVNQPVFEGVVNCTGKDMAKGSPFLEALFAIDGVSRVMVSGGTITVAKNSKEEWGDLARKVGVAIRDTMKAGGTMIAPDIKDKIPSNEELREKIQKVIDDELNPGLGMHGGSVELIDIQGTTVFMSMSGGCQGCAAASYTLKHGIEQILKSRVPEVTEIVDVTDHSAGVDPYYQ